MMRNSPMKPSTVTLKRAAFNRSDRIESREVTKLQLKAKEPKRRMKKCAVAACRQPFEPRSSWAKACSPECAVIYTIQEQKSYWVKLAQKKFNAYRREVCRLAGYGCICCNAPLDWVTPNKVDAGHYLSRGASPHLKFIENNVWAQRKGCNRPGGTTRQAFREGMEGRIGIEALKALEADKEPRHYTIDDLKEIITIYHAKLKQLKASTCHE